MRRMTCNFSVTLRALNTDIWCRGRSCLVLGLCALALLPISAAAAPDTPPNIVMILADDLSWVGTSVQMDPDLANSRSDYHQTPVLEQLAREGMVFSRAYAAAPVCGPSRVALETGMSPASLRVTDLRHAGQFVSDQYQRYYTGHALTPPLPRTILNNPVETTLGQMLKNVDPDYRTAVFGKFDWLPGPTSSGYDEGIAFLAQSANPNTDPKSMFSITNAGIDFMERKVAENKPFYVNFAHWATKPFTEALPATVSEFENLPRGTNHFDAAYAAMHKDFDTTIGMVMDKIAELGIEDNTYVFVTSDHGAPIDVISTLNNRPLYGGKGTLFEGGVRVPFLVKGPGITPATYSDVPITLIDLFPTFYELAGGTAPLPSKIEGTSLVDVLDNGGQLPAGQSSLKRAYGPNGEIFVHYPTYTIDIPTVGHNGPHTAIIDGDYKLVRRFGENGAPDTYLLFNLGDNILESNDPSSPLNLAAARPEKVAELKAKLDNWLQGVDASLPYDVRTPVQISWQADQRGSFPGIPNVWRSTTDLDSFDREVWYPSSFTPGRANGAPPALVESQPHQPGLPRQSFRFNGSQGFTHTFFHVSDAAKPDLIDADHSATFEFWVKLNDLTQNQLLFESGSADQGISLTFGDGDGDSVKDDVRFRVLGKDGNYLTVTADVNRFTNISKNYVQITAVLNDSTTERYAEIYVNGAPAARVDGIAGTNEINWDGVMTASMGMLNRNVMQFTGNPTDTLGGASGGGALPFLGGNLRGDIASFQFFNYRLTPGQVLASYNAMLEPVDHGVHSVTGDAAVPLQRPANVSHNAAEATYLQVIDERSDVLSAALPVDALIGGPITFEIGEDGTTGALPAGAKYTSYLLHFDPPGNLSGGGVQTITGSVQFQQEILAILFTPTALAQTDQILGAIGSYGAQGDRGIQFVGDDFLAISADQKTLSFDLSVLNSELGQFRVLTKSVLSADFDNSGRADAADLAIWDAAYGLSSEGDADFDGDTDGLDFLAWQRQSREAAVDFNHNGVVDQLDLARWEASYGKDAGGDANGDGVTDGRDFLAWQLQYQAALTAAAVAVPEPATQCLIWCASAALYLRRTRKVRAATSASCRRCDR